MISLTETFEQNTNKIFGTGTHQAIRYWEQWKCPQCPWASVNIVFLLCTILSFGGQVHPMATLVTPISKKVMYDGQINSSTLTVSCGSGMKMPQSQIWLNVSGTSYKKLHHNSHLELTQVWWWFPIHLHVYCRGLDNTLSSSLLLIIAFPEQ